MNFSSKDLDESDVANRDLFLSLLKKSLLATLYEESSWYIMGSRPEANDASAKGWLKKKILDVIHSRGFILAKPLPLDAQALKLREDGRTSGFFSHTMIGMHRLDNVQKCIETVVRENIEGDLIETGAWRGGSTIFMRGVLKSMNVTDRKVWVADSFEGFPDVAGDANAHAGDADMNLASFSEGGPLDLWLKVPLERVKANFERYGLLDGQVEFLKGWFEDTLPNAPIEKLAILRLDGDLYKSTMDALEALYHKVSPGGFVIVDDYGTWPQCKAAIHDFREREGITAPIEKIDSSSVFWRLEVP